MASKNTKMTVTKALIKKLSDAPSSILKYSKEDVEKILNYMDKKYHNTETPVVTDAVYDSIKDILKENNIEIAENVGALPAQDKKKVLLPYWMGSMDKITKQQAIDRFVVKYPGKYTITEKVDGVSALLVLNKTKNKMYTRGNGVYGQDISNIIGKIKNLSKISGHDHKGDVVIRGELIIPKKKFDTISHLGANARNMVSGIVNSKTVNEDLVKHVDFVAYTLIEPQLTPSKQYEFIQSLGLETVHSSNVSSSLSEEILSKILVERKSKSIYEIDGIIITHDKFYEIEQGKNPTFAFAFKNMSLLDTKESVVLDIEWNISKDGYIKPIVILTPIHLSGVVIKKATGFNAAFIKENEIGPGSIVTITRSGDVIPYITNIVKRTSAKMPTDLKYTWNETKKDIIVKGDSSEQHFKMMEHFYSKIKVKWLSTGTLRKLYDAGYTKPYDVYKVSKADLSKIIGDTMAAKIVLERDETFQDVTCHILMDASNMFGRGFGERKLKMVTDQIPRIVNGYVPTVDELIKIDGISNISAEQFIEGMGNYKTFMSDNPFNCNKKQVKAVKAVKGNSVLNGMRVMFTGFRNKSMEEFITANDGIIVTSLSKKTDILVIANDAVSNKKTEAAADNGHTRVVTQEVFSSEYMDKTDTVETDKVEAVKVKAVKVEAVKAVKAVKAVTVKNPEWDRSRNGIPGPIKPINRVEY